MLYFLILNPVNFQPAFERVPATAEVFQGRAQVFPSGAEVQVQWYDMALVSKMYYIVFEYDDGTAERATEVESFRVRATTSQGRLVQYYMLTVKLPIRRTFRMRAVCGDEEAVSGCITTEAPVADLRRLAFASDAFMEFDAVMNSGGYTFTPTVYIPGGFFTNGFTPAIDGESFLDGDRVSRYLSAWPSITRDFIMGGAQGLDNRLVAMLNAGFCLPSIEIDGEAYVRYNGAQFKALGDKSVPCRAWSVTLQHADGDYASYQPEGADGALVDATGAYLADAEGNYIKAN